MSNKTRYKDDFEGLYLRHHNFSRPGNQVSQAELLKCQPIINAMSWKFYNSGRYVFDRLGWMLEDVQSVAQCHTFLFLKDFSFDEPDRTKILRKYLHQRLSSVMLFAKRKVRSITEGVHCSVDGNDIDASGYQDFITETNSSHDDTPENMVIYLEECDKITNYFNDMQQIATSLSARWVKNNPKMFIDAKISKDDVDAYHKHMIISYANKYGFVIKKETKKQFRAFLADRTHKLAKSLAPKTKAEVQGYILTIKQQNQQALDALFDVINE